MHNQFGSSFIYCFCSLFCLTKVQSVATSSVCSNHRRQEGCIGGVASHCSHFSRVVPYRVNCKWWISRAFECSDVINIERTSADKNGAPTRLGERKGTRLALEHVLAVKAGGGGRDVARTGS